MPASPYTNMHTHSNIRDFMVQGGDPTGTGKGGESIWGGYMDDEFHPMLKVCGCVWVDVGGARLLLYFAFERVCTIQ